MKYIAVLVAIIFAAPVYAATPDELEKAKASIAVEMAMLMLKSPPKSTSQISPCNCGCVTTGSCQCKNCNEHTADPTYKTAKSKSESVTSPSYELWLINGQYVYKPVGASTAIPSSPLQLVAPSCASCGSCANGQCSTWRRR